MLPVAQSMAKPRVSVKHGIKLRFMKLASNKQLDWTAEYKKQSMNTLTYNEPCGHYLPKQTWSAEQRLRWVNHHRVLRIESKFDCSTPTKKSARNAWNLMTWLWPDMLLCHEQKGGKWTPTPTPLHHAYQVTPWVGSFDHKFLQSTPAIKTFKHLMNEHLR